MGGLCGLSMRVALGVNSVEMEFARNFGECNGYMDLEFSRDTNGDHILTTSNGILFKLRYTVDKEAVKLRWRVMLMMEDGAIYISGLTENTIQIRGPAPAHVVAFDKVDVPDENASKVHTSADILRENGFTNEDGKWARPDSAWKTINRRADALIASLPPPSPS